MKKFYSMYNYDKEDILVAKYYDKNANWYDLYDLYIPQRNIPSYFIIGSGEETDLLCSDMGWRIFSEELKCVFEKYKAEFNYLPVEVKGGTKKYYVAYFKKDYEMQILDKNLSIFNSLDDEVIKPVINLNYCQKYKVLNLDLKEENGRFAISEEIKNEVEKLGLVGVKFEEKASN